MTAQRIPLYALTPSPPSLTTVAPPSPPLLQNYQGYVFCFVCVLVFFLCAGTFFFEVQKNRFSMKLKGDRMRESNVALGTGSGVTLDLPRSQWEFGVPQHAKVTSIQKTTIKMAPARTTHNIMDKF